MTDPSSSPIALITGGGTGIGAASARRLAAMGFDVVLTGRRIEPLMATAASIGAQARARVMDVADAESVEAGVATLERCDVLVNNAGGALGSQPVEHGDVEQWRAMFESNVIGTLQVIKADMEWCLSRVARRSGLPCWGRLKVVTHGGRRPGQRVIGRRVVKADMRGLVTAGPCVRRERKPLV